MKIPLTLIIATTAAVLMIAGGSLYAIDGALSLASASLLWVGLMLALFLLYAKFGEVRSVLGKKTAKYGANLAVMITVFIGVIITLAVFSDTHKKRYDLSKTGRFTLSSQTKKLVGSLTSDVKAIAFYRNESGTMHAMQRQAARDLLEEYAGLSDKFTFTFIDPDANPGLASKYGVSEYRIIMLFAGDKQAKIGNEKEEKLTNGLIKLLKQKQKTVYFVTGHGEKDTASTNKEGYKAAKEALINESYQVKELPLLQVESIPSDASVVVLAGPTRDLDQAELDKLDKRYKSGGAIFAMIDPGHPAGFATWLEGYGFKLQNDIIIDQQSQVYGANYLTPVVYAYHKKHPLTQDFTLASYFTIANSVYMQEDPKQGRYELALTGPNSWTEVDKNQLESGQAEYNEDREKRGPIPVMAVTTTPAGEETDAEGTKREKYGKMILVGDSDFANNTNINLAGNGDLFLNTVNWLAEEADLIAVRAKGANVSPVILTASQGRAIFWIPVIMVPSAVLMAGIGVYSRRRWFR